MLQIRHLHAGLVNIQSAVSKYVQDHVQYTGSRSISIIPHPPWMYVDYNQYAYYECLSHPLLVGANLLNTAGWSLPCPEESSSSSSSSVCVFWLVTAQEHVVMQRPMPSPEQAISTD